MFLVSTTGSRQSVLIGDVLDLFNRPYKIQLNHPLVAFDLEDVILRSSLESSVDLANAFTNAWLKKVSGGIDPNNDEAVKTSSTDLVSGTLLDKLIAGNNITFEVINDLGGDQKLKINSIGGGSGGSDSNYVHTQLTASISWIVNHNLGKYPSVNIFDSSGSICDMSFKHLNLNTLIVEPATPVTGKVVCN